MSNLKHSSHHERVSRRRTAIQSFKARANAKRNLADKIADWLTESFGTVFFLGLNGIFFLFWITWNSGVFPHIPVRDPFPFGLLTMVVSLEAIFLAIVVLISQNRETKIAELREEVELYINTYAESEITKLIYLQTLLLEKSGIDISKDTELQEMLKTLESDAIEDELQRQLAKD
ncbi:MAG: DUF1003 domain-containing protein [Candidatus Pacebacteria bacterium]|nr:DUF1003 domain-containing protein [Candidatus Paceibacterota bacterium]MBP9832073.1 DUF1003 domain-containing protein [Candidatus Paceibacterota bacterium]